MNTYSLVFTEGWNTCINTCIHSGQPSESSGAYVNTTYSTRYTQTDAQRPPPHKREDRGFFAACSCAPAPAPAPLTRTPVPVLVTVLARLSGCSASVSVLLTRRWAREGPSRVSTHSQLVRSCTIQFFTILPLVFSEYTVFTAVFTTAADTCIYTCVHGHSGRIHYLGT